MLVPSVTVFFSSGCIVILELVASRLVARDLGSSLYTWTSIVGVVLAGISIGTYWGGRIADRYHSRRALAVLFGLSSAACVGIVVSNNWAGDWMWLWRLSWSSRVLVHVVLVFFLPSALLGTISPVAVKMALDGGLPAGRAVGGVYAWAAAGGIVGTFLAGFVLIPAFGSATILWLIGTAMLMMAVLYWISCWAMYLWGMVFIALMTMGIAGDKWAQDAGTAALLREKPDPNVVYQAETAYGHVAVKQVSKRPDTRVFVQDDLTRTEIVMAAPANLRHFHAKVYAGLTHGLSGDKKRLSMMVIGAGGYAFPRYLKASWPDSRIEVVEIDPGVTKGATEAFGLDRGTTIETISMDARNYVDQLAAGGPMGKSAQRYDFIYEDALNAYAVPPQLVTKEFNEKVAALLAEDGAYMIHLLDMRQGGRLLGAVVNTLRETFGHVYVIAGQAHLPSAHGDFVVVAAKRPLDPQAVLEEHNAHLRFSVLDDSEIGSLREGCGGVILTDDYAPVENLLAPVVRYGATAVLARKYVDKARELQGNYQYEQSVRWYRLAMETDPSMAVEAFEQIGLIYMARNKPEEAAQAFRQAIEAHARMGNGQAAIGPVHMYLGGLLGRMDRLKEAKEQLAEAIKCFRVELEEDPIAVVRWEWLGDTSAALGDFKGASDAFDRAMALEPRNPSHYQKLARALEFQRRYDEAVAVVRKHVKLVQEQGRRDLATQLSQYIEVLEYKKVKQAK
jgi:tetratricopeptide (TPR) repeat protein/MFS family permease